MKDCININLKKNEIVIKINEDAEYVNKLKSTFMPGKKIAAISAAVGSYQNAVKSQKMQK